jgi:RNA polymerase sigma factor (sigma-70 family)
MDLRRVIWTLPMTHPMNPLLYPPSRLAGSVLRTQSDERLTELARDGSDAAFEAIVARHRRSLLRHCSQIVGESDAEEPVQDALIKAHQALTRGDDVHNLRAWLHAIAYNAARNTLRARAARPDCLSGDSDELGQPDDSSDRRVELDELLKAVQSLPARQRDAIVMRELEGRSYAEIAARLGASDGAVRQLLNRARTAIRERVGALAGVEPVISWLTGGSGAATARLGALASGCTLAGKLCATALLPAVVGAGVRSISVSAPARHTRTATRTAQHPKAPQSTAIVHPVVQPFPSATPDRSRPQPLQTAANPQAPTRKQPTFGRSPPIGSTSKPERGVTASEDPRRGARTVRPAAQRHGGGPGGAPGR